MLYLDGNRDLGIEGVGFDLDGTIILTEELNLLVTEETCRRFCLNVKLSPRDIMGMANVDIFAAILKKNGQVPDVDLVERMSALKRNLFRERIDEAKPAPMAREIILELARKDVPLAVVTAAGLKSLEVSLESMDLSVEVFHAVLTSDNLTAEQRKPAPYPWEVARRQLGVSTLLGVEDSPKGMTSASNARGVYPCGILHTHSEVELWASGAQVVVQNFAELAERLGFRI